jgi:hypothetical protein
MPYCQSWTVKLFIIKGCEMNFWKITPSGPLRIIQCFRGTYRHHLPDRIISQVRDVQPKDHLTLIGLHDAISQRVNLKSYNVKLIYLYFDYGDDQYLRFVYVKLMICTVNGLLKFTVKWNKKKSTKVQHWGEGIGLFILKSESFFLWKLKKNWLQ